MSHPSFSPIQYPLANMVKLYYTPTSCGGASFIVAHALGLNIECEQVTLATHKTASGADFYAINPKGMFFTARAS